MEFIKHTTDGVPKGIKHDDLIAYRTKLKSGDLVTHIPVASKHLNWLKSDPSGISKSRPSNLGEIVEYAICQKHEKKHRY